MADIFTKKKRSAVMARIPSRGNRSTELRLMAVFQAQHISGWRRNSKLFGRPDFVFSKRRIAVFVDGDFWHGHPAKCRLPVQNRAYWRKKIARNKVRDRLVGHALRARGWRVLRIWEHALSTKNKTRLIARLNRQLNTPPA